MTVRNSSANADGLKPKCVNALTNLKTTEYRLNQLIMERPGNLHSEQPTLDSRLTNILISSQLDEGAKFEAGYDSDPCSRPGMKS